MVFCYAKGGENVSVVENLIVRIGADISNYEQNMTQVQQSMRSVGERMQSVGQTVGQAFTAAGLALGAGLGLAVNTAMDFEAQMSRVGAIAGATKEELEALKQSALDLGASTSKSATEIAQGQEALAALGFTTKDILGAMPGVISAAEASGSDMAQTAEVMASTLNIFGMEASNATKVADLLAKTANISAADLTDMGYALKYAGPPAAALGISLEELSASIGIMTNAGMDGSSAGTALRAALLGLLNPSEENSKLMKKMGVTVTDAQGNFVGLSKLVENLSTSMEGQTETQKAANLAALVGTEAVSGMLSLMSAGPAEIDKMTQSLANSGGASAEAAAKMKDNLKGAVDELTGAFETMQITIGTALAPALTKLAGIVQTVADWFNNLSPSTQSFIAISAAVTTVLLLLVGVVGFLTMALGALAAAEWAAIAPIAGIIAAVVGIILAIGALVVAVIEAYKNIDWFRDGVDTVWAAIKSAFQTALNFIMQIVNQVMEAVTKFFKSQLDKIQKFWAENGQQIMQAVRVVWTAISAYIQMVMAYIQAVWTVAWNVIKSVAQAVWSMIKGVISGAIDVILGIVKTFSSILTGDWKGAWEGVKNIMSGALNVLKSMASGMFSIGKNIITGLIDGVASAAKTLYNKVAEIASNVTKKFKNIFDIHSPSRVMRDEVGKQLGAGIVVGMGASLKGISTMANEMVSAATPNIKQTTTFGEQSNQVGKADDIRPVIIEIPIYLDSDEIGRGTSSLINNLQNSQFQTKLILNGVKE